MQFKDILSTAKVMIAPLFSGAGVKGKVRFIDCLISKQQKKIN
jgi:hypothetical protein